MSKNISPAVDFASECIELAKKYALRSYVVAATSVNPMDVTQVQRRVALGSLRGEGEISSSDAAMIIYDLVRWAARHPDVLEAIRAYAAAEGEGVVEEIARA